jgi:hypothetical protein
MRPPRTMRRTLAAVASIAATTVLAAGCAPSHHGGAGPAATDPNALDGSVLTLQVTNSTQSTLDLRVTLPTEIATVASIAPGATVQLVLDEMPYDVLLEASAPAPSGGGAAPSLPSLHLFAGQDYQANVGGSDGPSYFALEWRNGVVEKVELAPPSLATTVTPTIEKRKGPIAPGTPSPIDAFGYTKPTIQVTNASSVAIVVLAETQEVDAVTPPIQPGQTIEFVLADPTVPASLGVPSFVTLSAVPADPKGPAPVLPRIVLQNGADFYPVPSYLGPPDYIAIAWTDGGVQKTSLSPSAPPYAVTVTAR